MSTYVMRFNNRGPITKVLPYGCGNCKELFHTFDSPKYCMLCGARFSETMNDNSFAGEGDDVNIAMFRDKK